MIHGYSPITFMYGEFKSQVRVICIAESQHMIVKHYTFDPGIEITTWNQNQVSQPFLCL